MNQLIAVTGASGALGGRIATALAEAGTPQLLLGREITWALVGSGRPSCATS